MEAFLRRQGDVVRSKRPPSLRLREADDSYVLAEAIQATVDVVVTGDRDILEVALGSRAAYWLGPDQVARQC
jgi:predicted nucleic acid-binding protein